MMDLPRFPDGGARLLFRCRACGHRRSAAYRAAAVPGGLARTDRLFSVTPDDDAAESCVECGSELVDATPVVARPGGERCGPRCTHAQGPDCSCVCEGAHHGEKAYL